jgi:hypothetical protein
MIKFDYFGPVEMQQATSDMNLYNNLCQAVKKMAENQNHDNFVGSIAAAYNYLNQYCLYELDYVTIENNNAYGDSLVPYYLKPACIAISDKTGYDHFSSLMGIVGAGSVAMNGRYIADLGNNWLEPVLTYLLFLAPSGSRKSFFINLLKQPIEETLKMQQETFDKKAAKEADCAKLIKDELKASRRRDAKKLRSECGLLSDSFDLDSFVSEIKELWSSYHPHIKKQDEISEQLRPLLFMDKTTDLGLMRLMQGHKSLAILDQDSFIISELSKQSGNKRLINLLLKSYDNESISYSNYHKSNDIMIDKPSLNIMTAFQTDRAVDFFRRKQNIASGLVGRFSPLFANPNAFILNSHSNQDQIKSNLQEFGDLLSNIFLANSRATMKQQQNYVLSDEAKHLLLNFAEDCRNAAQTSLKFISTFVLKNVGRAVRLACVLSHLHNPDKLFVSSVEMKYAINICLELQRHAAHASGPAGIISINAAQKIEEWFKCSKTALFDYRQAKQCLNSQKYSPEIVANALNLLCCQHHVICIPGLKRSVNYLAHSILVDPINLPPEYRYQFRAFAVPKRHIQPVTVSNLLPPGCALNADGKQVLFFENEPY